jgi:transposase-like protein
MARNKVQFQKGLSVHDFLHAYDTEDQCFDALYALRWPDEFQCPHCGHDKHCQLTVRKLQQCNRCDRQTSVTAGTIFESTKLPLTVWFQAMYLLTQNKKGVSGMALHRQLGISYNAAWRLKHKLMQVMLERDHDQPLTGFVEMDDAFLGGERTGCRGATGKTPFVAAVETTKDGCPTRIKLPVVKGFRSAEIKAWTEQHLTPGSTVISDGLACFNAVT